MMGASWYPASSRASRLAAPRVLLLGNPEQQDRRDAHGGGVLAFLEQLVDGEPELARHGRDRLADAAAVESEERVDEVVRPERGLAHHLPDQRRLSKPTGSIEWVRHFSSSFAPRSGRRWRAPGPGWCIRPA